MSATISSNQSINLGIISILTRTYYALSAKEYLILFALSLITFSTIFTCHVIGLNPAWHIKIFGYLLWLISYVLGNALLHYTFKIAEPDPKRSFMQCFDDSLAKSDHLLMPGVFLAVYATLAVFINICAPILHQEFLGIQLLVHVTLSIILCPLILAFDMRFKAGVHSIKEALRFVTKNFPIFSKYWILLLAIGTIELFFYAKILFANLNILDIYFTVIYLINLFLFIFVNVFLERALTKYPPVIL